MMYIIEFILSVEFFLLVIFFYYDAKKLSKRFWETVPINMYSVTKYYDIVLDTKISDKKHYRNLMKFSDYARSEIEGELGGYRLDYLTLKTIELSKKREKNSYEPKGFSCMIE